MFLILALQIREAAMARLIRFVTCALCVTKTPIKIDHVTIRHYLEH